MGQYFYTLICAAVVCAVVVALSPGGETGKLGRFVAYIGALAISLCMLSPLPGILEKDIHIGDASTEAESERDFENEAEYYANSMGMTLEKLFGTPVERLNARVEYSSSDTPTRVILIIDGAVSYDTEDAEKILSDIYKISVEIREEE